MRALGWVLAAAVALGALVGCDRAPAAEPAPTPTVAAPTPLPLPSATAGQADGLDIRYLDRDGTIKTLKPKDFKR